MSTLDTIQPVKDGIRHEFKEGSLVLPDTLIDKTVHVFNQANGKTDFNIVMTRVEVLAGEDIETFANRVIAELRSTLTRFNLETQEQRNVAGRPAYVLNYTWRTPAALLHQRQALMIAPTDNPDKFVGVQLIGSCQGMFVYPYTEWFDQALAGLSWRYAHEPAAAGLPVDSTAQDAGTEVVFALHNDGTLHVFRDLAALKGAAVSPLEVEEQLWKFYAFNGQRLDVHWVKPNKGRWLKREPGEYELRPSQPGAYGSLQSRLALIEEVKGFDHFNDTESLLAHLSRHA